METAVRKPVSPAEPEVSGGEALEAEALETVLVELPTPEEEAVVEH